MAELTIQERRIADLAADGLSNREIGKALSVTEDTVKTHIRRMLRKLNALNRAHIVALVLREGEPTAYADRLYRVRSTLADYKAMRGRAPEGSLFAAFYDELAVTMRGAK